MVLFDWIKQFFKNEARQLTLGEVGESLAADFLRQSGLKIIASNYRTRAGEIDLVASEGEYIVFVEVKTRKSNSKGEPFESVTFQKQKKLTQLAWGYLKRHRLVGRPIRFDVVSILMATDLDDEKPHIQHYRSAFEAVE